MSEQIVSLFGQLLKLNLKQFQDNFRLKKFCNNHGNFLQNYANSAQRRNQRAASKSSQQDSGWAEICEQFVENYSNVESELFNEYNSIKAMLTKMNYFDYSKFDESQNGFEEILFGQTQSLMILLDSDNTNFVMLKKFLQTWLKSDENNKSNSKLILPHANNAIIYPDLDDDDEDDNEVDGGGEIVEMISDQIINNVDDNDIDRFNYNNENNDHHRWSTNLSLNSGHKSRHNTPMKNSNVNKISYEKKSTISNNNSSSSTKQLPVKQLYYCRFCSVKYSVINGLVRHVINEHDSNFFCANCNKRFNHNVQFAVHLRKRTCFGDSDSPATMTMSPKTSKPHSNQTGQHLSAKDSNVAQNLFYDSSSTSKLATTDYSCCYCNESFKKQTHLAQHIRTFHQPSYNEGGGGGELLTDDDDDVNGVNNENRSQSFQMNFQNRFGVTPHSHLTANVKVKAAKILSDKKKLLQKLKESDAIEIPSNDEQSSQHGTGDFFCCVCNMDFTRSYYLVDHIAEYHTRNCCVGCNRQFKSRTTLNRHVKESACTNRSPLRQHVCNFCVLTFKRENHLYQHLMRRHGNDPKLVELVMKNYDGMEQGDDNGDDTNNANGEDGAGTPTNEGGGGGDEDEEDFDDEMNGLNRTNGFDGSGDGGPGGSGGDDDSEEFNNFQLNTIEQFMDDQGQLQDSVPELSMNKIKELSCPECSISFQEISEFVLHLEKSHLTPKGKFECFECRTLFKSRQNMSRHVRESYCYNFPERPFQCKICHRDFKRNSHLNTHMTRIHPDQKLNEMLGINDGSNKANLMTSMVMIADEDEPVVDVSKLMQTSMTTGCVELSGSDDDGRQNEKAPSNGSTNDNNAEDVARGDGEEEENGKKVKKIPKTESDSEIVTSWNLDPPSVDDDLKCKWPECTFVGTAIKQVTEHWKMDHLGWNQVTDRYRCTKCNEEFEEESDCSRHWRLEHFSVKYRCNFGNGSCEFETTSRQQLKEHREKSHTKLKCDFANCDKTFLSRSLMAHHVRRAHPSELCCPWPNCTDSFTRAEELRDHLVTHNGTKNSYRCNFDGCDMSFRNQGGLYLHRKRHETQLMSGSSSSQQSQQPFVDTMFECCWPDCKRRFSNQTLLNSHFETHTFSSLSSSGTVRRNSVESGNNPMMMYEDSRHSSLLMSADVNHSLPHMVPPLLPPPPLLSFSGHNIANPQHFHESYLQQQQQQQQQHHLQLPPNHCGISPGSNSSSSSSTMIHPTMMMSSEIMLTNSCPIPHCYTNFENQDLLQQHIESVHMNSVYSSYIH